MRNNESDIAEPVISQQQKERRYVYNGEPSAASVEGVPRGNRPIKKRKRSPFYIIATMLAISLLIVSYVWNKLTVNRLAVEVNEVQMQYQRILYANEVLRAEVNKKSSLDRIGKIATDQLGMIYPKEQPVWFTLTQKQLDNIVK
jgi:cell division protein FtsL